METTSRPAARDVYAIITERITAALERGTAPWHQTWTAGMAPQSLVTRHPYRGVNVFVLSMTARAAGYGSPYWVTYNQARGMGGNVKRGEHGTPVVFWKFFDAPAADDAGELEAIETTRARRRPPLLRYYTVFNVEQTEGIAVPAPLGAAPVVPIDAAERIVAGMPRAPRIVESVDGGAYYAPRLDTVYMPARCRFGRSEDFYAVLFHELTHSTGHVSRLNRSTLNEAGRFGRCELLARRARGGDGRRVPVRRRRHRKFDDRAERRIPEGMAASPGVGAAHARHRRGAGAESGGFHPWPRRGRRNDQRAGRHAGRGIGGVSWHTPIPRIIGFTRSRRIALGRGHRVASHT
jgi:antirestriction protein ArdC